VPGGVLSRGRSTLLGMTSDTPHPLDAGSKHDPVLALVRSHLDPGPGADPGAARRARDEALAEIQRHPAVLVDTALQLAELCAALAEAVGDRLGRRPAELVETYRGLLRMVDDDRTPLRLVGVS
jgi:hypothetical protein